MGLHAYVAFLDENKVNKIFEEPGEEKFAKLDKIMKLDGMERVDELRKIAIEPLITISLEYLNYNKNRSRYVPQSIEIVKKMTNGIEKELDEFLKTLPVLPPQMQPDKIDVSAAFTKAIVARDVRVENLITKYLVREAGKKGGDITLDRLMECRMDKALIEPSGERGYLVFSEYLKEKELSGSGKDMLDKLFGQSNSAEPKICPDIESYVPSKLVTEGADNAVSLLKNIDINTSNSGFVRAYNHLTNDEFTENEIDWFIEIREALIKSIEKAAKLKVAMTLYLI